MERDKLKFSFIFSDGIPVGGVEVSSLRLARALSTAGHEVWLVVHGGLQLELTKLGEMVTDLQILELPSAKNMSVTEMGVAYAALGDSYVFPNQFARGYEALRYAKQSKGARLKILGICHSDHDDYYQLAVDNQDLVDIQFGVSQWVCNKLDRLLHNPSRLLILGVEIPKEYIPRPKRKHLEILYAGRIENSGKRCSELIPAGEWLRKEHIPFRMTIVGDGPYYKWLFDDLRSVKWWNRRRFRIVGSVAPKEMKSYYEQADIYLSFTRFEGNSIAIMEAMAHGCVPVVSRVSGTETVVQDGTTGCLGVVDQPQTLLDHVERLHHHREELTALSRAAYNYAREACAVQNTVVFIEDCVREIEK